MENEKVTSSILSEHRKVVNTRYPLALLNFLVIFAGTLVTLFFVSRRGVYNPILIYLYALAGINIVQIILCITEYFLRVFKGINLKWLPPVSYIVGLLWLLALVGEVLAGTTQLGTLRTDLAAIAAIQFVVALIAYFYWPMMDRRAIDAMIRPSIRGDVKKRAKKARSFARRYGFLCFLMFLAQIAALLAYKLPPTFYDLFADTRAVEYQLNEDGNGYVVTSVYKGTATTVVIPATYNNLPVVGIAKGALVDYNMLDKYQITNIVLGTETVNENGDTVLESNLTYIANDAIHNNKITALTLPVSINSIGKNAITSTSLRTLDYYAAAEFKFESYAGCSALTSVTMLGEEVGKIVSLEGMDPTQVTLQVDKNIYNSYRQNNLNYLKSFRPIIGEDEFCIDFYTDCEYYVNSIFSKIGERVDIDLSTLDSTTGSQGTSIRVDTLAYIKDPTELGTEGAKADSAFRGWYTDSSFANKCEFTEDGIVSFTSSTSIYAKWINEYEASLDWGTFKPEDQVDKVYWTEQDLRSFPTVTDRVGYKAGVYWTLADTQEQVTNSDGITNDVTLHATWVLDCPVISIAPSLMGGVSGEEPTPNYAQFVYDETKALTLTATHSHPLDGHRYNNQVTNYTYEWVKSDASFFNQNGNIRLQNVAQTGLYTLKVTVHSPYGDTAVSEIGYETMISKKPLKMGNTTLTGNTFVYNAGLHTLEYTGTPEDAETLQTTYMYYKMTPDGKEHVATGDGVMNAGDYRVAAVFSKIDPTDASNYETKILEAPLKITPKELSFVEWSNDTFVYNGMQREVVMRVDGILRTDEVNVLYIGNTATNAGEGYTAVAQGVDNPNYSIKEIQLAENDTHNWKITPKTVTVRTWQSDANDFGAFTFTYDAMAHSVYALPDGVVAGDDFDFTYDTANNSVNVAINAGSYTATITGVNNSNYYYDPDAPDSNASKDWTITPRPLHLSYLTPLLTYNGGVQNAGATISNFVGDDEAKLTLEMLGIDTKTVAGIASATNGTLALSFGATNASTYEVSISGLITSGNAFLNNYTLEGAQTSFTIAPKALYVTRQSAALTYNGNVQEYLLYVNGIVAQDLPTFEIGHFETTAQEGRVDGSSFLLVYKAANAGSYNVAVSALNSPSGNYTLAQTLTSSYTIGKRPVSISAWQITNKADGNATDALSSGQSVIYNYHGYTVTATLTGMVEGHILHLTYSNNFGKDASTYTTTAAFAEQYDNYMWDSQAPNNAISWEIKPYALDLTWKVNGQTGTEFTYNGAAWTATPSWTPLLGDDTMSLIYDLDNRVLTNVGLMATTRVGTNTSNKNYVISGGKEFSFKILPKTVTVTWNKQANLVYDGQAHGPSFTLEGLVGSDVQKGNLQIWASAEVNRAVTGNYNTIYNFNVEDASATYSFTRFATESISFGVDAGYYAITALAVYNDTIKNINYTITMSEVIDFEIEKKELELTGKWTYTNAKHNGSYALGDDTLVYNNNTFTLSTTIVTNSVLSRLGTKDELYLYYKNNSYTAANTSAPYTATVSGIGGTYAANYCLPSANRTMEWFISPKPIKLSWQTNSFVYSGQMQYQYASVASGAQSDNDYKIYDATHCPLQYEQNASVAAGFYTAKVVDTGNTNYVLDSVVGNATYNWQIAKLPVTLSWSYTSTIYNGQAQHPTATVRNPVGTAVNVTGYTGYANNKNMGTDYTVTASELDNANYTLVNGQNLTTTYQITARSLTYNWYYVYAGDTTRHNLSDTPVYNGKELTVYVEFTNICGNDDVAPHYGSLQDHTFINAGSHTVSATLTGAQSGNYTLSTDAQSKSFSISRKSLGLSWLWDDTYTTRPTIIYDGSKHTLTASPVGVVSGDSVTLSYNWDDQTCTNAKTYTLSVSITDPNYVLSSNTNTLVISPQPVSITWSGAQSVVYDKNSHYLRAEVVGANDGKAVSFTYSSNTAAVNVASYPFTVGSLSDTNYTLSNCEGDRTAYLNVTPRSITVSWSNATSFVYDGQARALTPRASGLITDDTCTLTINGDTGNYTSVGAYTVTVTDTKNPNYTVSGVSNLKATMQIIPRPVTVTWADADSFEYTGSIHSLTAQVTDANGNNIPFSYENNHKTDANTYLVSVKLQDSNNYVFAAGTPTSKNLVITKRTLTVIWTGASAGTVTYYAGRSYTAQASFGRVVSGDTVTPVYASEINGATNVGTYTAKVSALAGSDANNYQLPDTNCTMTLEIVPQALKITWSGTGTVEYDGKMHSRIPTAKGYSDGQTVAISYTTTSYSAVGSYNYSVTASNNKNYTLYGATGSLTADMEITPRVISIDWGDTLTQDAAEFEAPTPIVTNTVTGETVHVVVEYPAEFDANAPQAGTYTLTITGLSGKHKDNYTITGATNLTAQLTITEQQ